MNFSYLLLGLLSVAILAQVHSHFGSSRLGSIPLFVVLRSMHVRSIPYTPTADQPSFKARASSNDPGLRTCLLMWAGASAARRRPRRTIGRGPPRERLRPQLLPLLRSSRDAANDRRCSSWFSGSQASSSCSAVRTSSRRASVAPHPPARWPRCGPWTRTST